MQDNFGGEKDLLGMTAADAEVLGVTRLTDGNGRVFEKQGINYMHTLTGLPEWESSNGQAEEYERQKGVYVLDKPKMRRAKSDLVVLHPLPRVDEITVEVDDDPRAKYFEQTEYGLYARMALMVRMLEGEGKRLAPVPAGQSHACGNPHCITHQEPYLPPLFEKAGDLLVCRYCEERTLLP